MSRQGFLAELQPLRGVFGHLNYSPRTTGARLFGARPFARLLPSWHTNLVMWVRILPFPILLPGAQHIFWRQPRLPIDGR